MALLVIIAIPVYFALGNIILIMFHTDRYGVGKISVGDYIRWQWLWPLPIAYILISGLLRTGKRMAKKVRGKKNGQDAPDNM